jgi:hypothetical protein
MEIPLLIVIFIRTDAVMKGSSLPTPFWLFQDPRHATLPNGYPIIKRQWLFSRLSKKMQVIGHDDVSSDKPVDVSEPGCLKGRVDLSIS